MTTTPEMVERVARAHYWADCEICGRMVICGKCGNNCCNGGYGTLPDGALCDACPDAYVVQAAGETEIDAALGKE